MHVAEDHEEILCEDDDNDADIQTVSHVQACKAMKTVLAHSDCYKKGAEFKAE